MLAQWCNPNYSPKPSHQVLEPALRKESSASFAIYALGVLRPKHVRSSSVWVTTVQSDASFVCYMGVPLRLNHQQENENLLCHKCRSAFSGNTSAFHNKFFILHPMCQLDPKNICLIRIINLTEDIHHRLLISGCVIINNIGSNPIIKLKIPSPFAVIQG